MRMIKKVCVTDFNKGRETGTKKNDRSGNRITRSESPVGAYFFELQNHSHLTQKNDFFLAHNS